MGHGHGRRELAERLDGRIDLARASGRRLSQQSDVVAAEYRISSIAAVCGWADALAVVVQWGRRR
jgi:hypothetical protein